MSIPLRSSVLSLLHNRIKSYLRRPARTLLLPALIASVSLMPSAVRADTVILISGEHLTGNATKLDGGKLTLHTDFAGDIAINFDKISSIKIDKPVVLLITTKNGKKSETKKVEITGIDRTPTGFNVTTAAAATEAYAAAQITTVRTLADQEAYEASLHPGWLHAWAGAANISFALARGNSDTTTVGTGITAMRPTPTDKTALYFSQIYTHDGVADNTTAEHLAAGARYDHNLGSRIFAFGTTDFATDALQFLDLRSVLGGGIGWHVIAKERQQLDLLAGLVWTHENYGYIPPNFTTLPPTPAVAPVTNSFAALDFGEQYSRKLGASSALTEQAYIFPNLDDTSQYRATFNGAISTKIKSFLSWQTTISDVYVTNPPPTTKSNDFILTTGLGFSFARK